MSGHRGRVAGLAVLAVAVILVVVALGRGEGGSGSATSGGGPGAPSAGSAESPADEAADEPLVEVQHTEDAAAPARIRIPSRGIDSTLDSLEVVAGGGLETPPHWETAGWYAGGPAPGDKGPAVIAGHVDSPSGPAVFTRLPGIAPGEEIEVTDTDGTTRIFAVSRTETTPKRGFPTQAVYGPVPDAQLRLITCSGAYDADRGGYQDNLLVYAVEVTP